MTYTVGILLFGMLLGLILEWIVVHFFMPNTALECESLETSLKARRADNLALQQQVQTLQAALACSQSNDQAQIAAMQATLLKLQDAQQQLVAAQSEVANAQAIAQQAQSEMTDVRSQLAQTQAQLVALSSCDDGVEIAQVVATDGGRVKPVQLELAAATLPVIEDLTRLNGIGPKLAEAMQNAGIHNYAQLSEMTADEIAICLNGIRYNKNLLDSWPKQAVFAAQKDWNGLKQFQSSLK